MKWLTGLAAGLALSAGTVHAADKWDMLTAYVDSNYHTQTGKLFAEAVGVCTGGDLEIVVHGGGTLFKGGEIKRAVQTGRAPIGERLLSAHQNENAVFGFDSVPFLASSFEASDRLWQAARGRLTEILAEQNLVLLYSIPWPPQGMYFEREIGGIADMGGIKFRTNNAATARLAALAKMLPVHVEAAELRQALATGVADAFDALDAQTRNCLRSASLLAEAAGTTRARELTDWYMAQLRVRPETLCRITEFSEHESNGRELDEGERVAVEVLPVLGQSAAAVEPGDGAFDHPTPGLDDEALHPIGSLDDLGLEIGQDAGQGAVKDRALIGAVGEQFPEKGKQTEQGRQQRETAVAILNVGGGDDAVQQQALRIDQNMPLLALDQLAGIEAVAVDASPPFSALFTL